MRLTLRKNNERTRQSRAVSKVCPNFHAGHWKFALTNGLSSLLMVGFPILSCLHSVTSGTPSLHCQKTWGLFSTLESWEAAELWEGLGSATAATTAWAVPRQHRSFKRMWPNSSSDATAEAAFLDEQCCFCISYTTPRVKEELGGEVWSYWLDGPKSLKATLRWYLPSCPWHKVVPTHHPGPKQPRNVWQLS